MMKKILSLCLAVVMLLGIVAMGVSAEELEETPAVPAFKDVKVVLTDGIALKFTFEGLETGTRYVVNLASEEFTADVAKVANEAGEISVIYDALTPAQFGMEVTATLEGTELTRTTTVMEYCSYVMNNLSYADEARAVVVDLLNYAYATELYLDKSAAAPAVNATYGRDLTDAEKAAFQAFTKSSIKLAGTNKNIFPNVLEAVGITYESAYSNNSLWPKLFAVNEGGDYTGLLDRANVEATELMNYDMVVPGAWGGSSFEDNFGYAIGKYDFRIGDLMLVRTGSGGTYVLLYQGDDDFVVWNSQSKNNRYDTTMDLVLNSFLKGEGFKYLPGETTTDPETGTEVITYPTKSTGGIMAYCIFRASRILPNLTTSAAPAVGANAWLGTSNISANLTALDATPNQDGMAVTFGSAMPILGDSIGYRFYITSEVAEGTVIKGQLAGSEAIELTVQENANGKFVDFTALTPADLSKVDTVTAFVGEEQVSIAKQFSGEGYAAWVMTGSDAKLQNLVSAMMIYAKGAQNYVAAGREYNSQLVNIEDCNNIDAVLDRISKITDEEIIAASEDVHGHGNSLLLWVYKQAGIKVNHLFAGSSNNDVINWSKNTSNIFNAAVVTGGVIDQQSGGIAIGITMDELQIGDLIYTRNTDTSDPNYVATYTAYAYLGNGRFIRTQTKGYDNVIVMAEAFDNPDTTDVVETIFDYSPWYRLTVLRISQVVGYEE